MKRMILTLALLLLIPAGVSAQQPDCRHRTILVSVVYPNEVPIAGLSAENFRGEYRGKPVHVVSVKLEMRPRRIVILLDLSGSMAMGNKVLVAKFLASHALLSVPTGSQMALLTFGNTVKLRLGFEHSKENVAALLKEINSLDQMSFKGRTALWDAIGEAARLLHPAQPGDVVYAVTDGGDSASHLRAFDVEKSMLVSGLRFFAYLVASNDSFQNRTPEELSGPRDVADLAEATGGGVLELRRANLFVTGDQFDLSPEGRKRISEAADAIYTQMRQFYFLEIELMNAADRPRSWKLELLPDVRRQLKGVSLHYPQKLFPCSTAKATQPPAPK